MTIIVIILFAVWAWNKWWPVPVRPAMPPTWVIGYMERGRAMEFLVYATTEGEALVKYMKAGYDPKRITVSRAVADGEI